MPTNAQLTLMLLRKSEASNVPLPPTPCASESPPVQPIHIPALNSGAAATTWEPPLGATHGELREAAAPDQTMLDAAGGPSSEIKETTAHRPHRLLELMKSGMKSTVKMVAKADKLRGKAGRQSAKNRVGIIPYRQGVDKRQQGPWSFRARNDGKDGQLNIASMAVSHSTKIGVYRQAIS